MPPFHEFNMEETTRRALLAMHNHMYDGMLSDSLKFAGYRVSKAGSVDEMLSEMGIPLGSPADFPPANKFEWYIMDINLGTVGGDSCDPALTVYGHVRGDVESGRSQFMAISGNHNAVGNATGEGIPCLNKANTVNLLEMIEASER